MQTVRQMVAGHLWQCALPDHREDLLHFLSLAPTTLILHNFSRHLLETPSLILAKQLSQLVVISHRRASPSFLFSPWLRNFLILNDMVRKVVLNTTIIHWLMILWNGYTRQATCNFGLYGVVGKRVALHGVVWKVFGSRHPSVGVLHRLIQRCTVMVRKLMAKSHQHVLWVVEHMLSRSDLRWHKLWEPVEVLVLGLLGGTRVDACC